MSKNIIKIEPSPFKRSTVKIQRQQVSTVNGKVQFKSGKDGRQVARREWEDEKNLMQLPGTVRVYKQAITKDGLNTGLDEAIPNPYKDEDYYKAGWEPILKGKPYVKRQHVLEYKHNWDFNYLTNKDLTSRTTNLAHQQGKPLSFFQKPDSHINLKDGVTILNLDNPRDEVLYYSCLVHRNIANSYAELQNNPHATHYIVDEQQKQAREADSKRKYNRAGTILEELINLPDGTIQDFCKVLGIDRKNMSKESAYAELEDYYRRTEENFQEFNYTYDTWKDMGTRPRFRAQVELYNYLTAGIITTRNNKYYWNQPDPESSRRIPWEWPSKDKAIEFLLAPEYQAEVEILEELYKAKTLV
jgi:hypothetical protein